MELQLTHSQEVKAVIDRAWGVVHHKQKKEKGAGAAENPSAGSSGPDRESLELKPFGQDSKRERYWVADGPCSFTFAPEVFVLPYCCVILGILCGIHIGFFRFFSYYLIRCLMPRANFFVCNIRFTAYLCVNESMENVCVVQGGFLDT